MDSLLINVSRRAWFGSMLFHLVLVLILLLLFRFQPERELSSEGRNAAGGILIKQINNNAAQYSGEEGLIFSETNESQSEIEIDKTLTGRFTDFSPLPPPDKIGVGRNINADSNIGLFEAHLPINNQANSIYSGADSSSGLYGDGKKRLRVFALQAEGNNFVFVFDKSGSMNERGGTPFKAAKSELIRNIQELNNEKCKFNIIFYNDEINQLCENGMLETTELNCKNAINFVYSEVARGNTKHFEPLVKAIKQKPDAIFFLTDGDDNNALTQTQLNEIKRINQLIKVQINVIQFGVGKYRESEFLIQLAKDNNGLYSYVNVDNL
ncbi:MAG: VWA domain-containing protein [Planctomycetaceae bacterium]|jgi:hypothetical protein|nr:VWA domain-containing protein [Planctomycetaceae bacterium]